MVTTRSRVFSPRERMRGHGWRIVFLLLIAATIGVVTGTLAVAFRYLLLETTALFWGESYDLVAATAAMPWYLVVAIPVAGGLILGPILERFAPEARGAGVPEVIESVVTREGNIRHRTTLFKMFCTTLSLGCGASVGREGPVVHIGSSVGSSLAQLMKLSPEWKRVFLACGAAAGIAATFNAPMAGMLFAAEIILVDFQINYLSQIAVSAVTATVVSHRFLGSFPTFDVPAFQLLSYWEIPLYLILGVLAGFLAIVFIQLINRVEDSCNLMKLPLWSRPALGGVLVGGLALLSPYVLGVGYQAINEVLTADLVPAVMVAILLAKLAATAISVGVGFSGGIFAPSLVLGGLLGGLFGCLAQAFAPHLVAEFPVYALVGMAAMVSGTTLAPITAIFTIFELTYNFEIILPLMTSCIASLVIVQSFYGLSIYETRLVRRGVKIVRGRDINLLRSLLVADYMEQDFEQIDERMPLGQLVALAQESSYPHFVVVNDEGRMVGMVSMRDLKACLSEMGELCELVVASEIMTHKVITITAQQNLEAAFELFEKKPISTLPVVSTRDGQHVVGVLKKTTLIHAYNQNILKIGVES
ncbi:chloride channel protein [Desulfuromonas acetoxidans]|uniref:Cl- channel, voltage gated n=1 Tax=Desulfuromonas acetoxidans (strain DSM 684 / 11070) TaxID=281689 RepID=Q1K0X2_DESA6|nr:chloride channel protein [Desulfuromonas acetoxidans]EAT16236.1 Cl- channel, voltage gated [Desulfuromonas acetoxidans DSM 684]MBF0645190.1 chloride channel protein [Desulfuromonas acetoxidans]NVD23066.1 chloride channel protein [Desulfuromonas acetoxidans]NVE15693.1 chloride channel protein [Desulfuromonas acetoxidans]